MATNHGPKTTSNGLVFAYDMYDVRNSYLGEPTTNIAASSYPTLNSNSNWWINSGAANFSDNDTSIPKPNIPNVDNSKYVVFSYQTTTAGNQHLGSAIISVSPSTQYLWILYNHNDGSTTVFENKCQ
jgi:hypothetical protein